jgi:hypothetical protein
MNTTVAQNKAHREDLTWIKVGRSEYLRSDGVSITKVPHISTSIWEVRLPNGEIANAPGSENCAARWQSLTVAKYYAQNITVDSTPYNTK